MKSSRKKTRIAIFIIVLLTISLGYAFVYGDLKLEGLAIVKKQTWNVYFNNLNVTNGSVTPVKAASLSGSYPTTVNYSVSLEKPGDYYEFTVDAVNGGTIDAMVESVSSTDNGNPISLPNYIEYKASYYDDVTIEANQLLAANTRETYRVGIYFKNDLNEEDLEGAQPIDLRLKFSVTYGQATDEAIPKPLFVLPSGRTRNNLQVGDEICISSSTGLGDQCFKFIKYDENDDAVMLARYNLKVGFLFEDEDDIELITGEYTSSDPGYGMQNVESGLVPFSKTNYWMSGENLLSPYNQNNTIYYDENDWFFKYRSNNNVVFPDVYNPQYNSEPEYNASGYATNSSYSVAYYLEAYKDILESNNVIIKTARLLTYTEATDPIIGCNGDTRSCPTNSFTYRRSYWLGSAMDEENLWWIVDNRLNSTVYSIWMGVRPVIVVEKSNL